MKLSSFETWLALNTKLQIWEDPWGISFDLGINKPLCRIYENRVDVGGYCDILLDSVYQNYSVLHPDKQACVNEVKKLILAWKASHEA